MDSGPTLPCMQAMTEGNAEGILRSRITSSADGPARTRERHRVRLCRPDSRARSAPSSTPFAAVLSLPTHSRRMISSSIRWTSLRYLWPLVYWSSSAPRARTAFQRKMLPAPRPTTSPNIPGPRKCGTPGAVAFQDSMLARRPEAASRCLVNWRLPSPQETSSATSIIEVYLGVVVAVFYRLGAGPRFGGQADP